MKTGFNGIVTTVDKLQLKNFLLPYFLLVPLICFAQQKAETESPDTTSATEQSEDESELESPQPSSVGSYGYISFTILPGFKSIRLDRETVVGMSEMILVPEGSHWVEITSPAGYADSSFKISVVKGEIVKKEIRLRNEISGEFAKPAPEKKPKKGMSTMKKILMYTSFAVGGLAAVGAISEEQKASEAREIYDNTRVASDEVYDRLYNNVDTHTKQRNGLGALSVLSFGFGLILLIF